MSVEVPQPVAMVLCDRVILDHRARQRSLIGITNVISAFRFPAMHPALSIYLALTGGRGSMACEFRLVEMGQTKPMLQLPGKLEFGESAELTELDITLQGIQFQRRGKYQVQFWANNQFVIDRLLTVQLVQVQPPTESQPAPPPAQPMLSAEPPRTRDKDFVIKFDPPAQN